MDFDFSEEQQDLQNLAKQILEGELSHRAPEGDRRRRRPLRPRAVGEARRGRLARCRGARGARRSWLRLPRGVHRARAGRAHGRAGAVPRLGRARRAADRAVRHPTRRRTRCCRQSSRARACSPPRSSSSAPTRSRRRRRRRADGDGWVLDGVKDCVPAGPDRRRGARARAHRRRRCGRSRSSTRPRRGVHA